jgi:hypothetical protein
MQTMIDAADAIDVVFASGQGAEIAYIPPGGFEVMSSRRRRI